MAENLGLPEGFVIDDNSTELPEGFVMDESPVQEEEQGFFGAVGEDLSQRGAEIANIAGGGYPEQTIGEDILQTGGQIIGGIGDVAGEAIGRGLSAITPDVIEDPVVGYTKQLLGAAGETGAAQQAGEYIQDLTTEYPRAARNLGAAFNVASAIPAVGVARAGGKVVEDVSKAISSGKPVTLGDLKAAETEAYNKARTQASESGTLINTGGVKRRIDFNLKNSFGKPNVGRVDIDIHPKAAKAIEKIKDRFADKSIDPIEIEHTRRLLGDFVESSKDLGRDTADTVKLYHVMDAFDDAVEGIKPDEFVKGNKEFIDSFNEARKISSVRFKTEPLQDIFDKAENAPKNSSYEQSLKNGFRSLANNKRKMKKYNEKEKFLIRQAARTGKIEGITNKFAVFSPTSGKLGAAITGGLGTGAVTGNPALAIIPAAGMASKAISDKMARGSAQRAYEGVAGQLNPRPSLRDRAKALYGIKTGESQ